MNEDKEKIYKRCLKVLGNALVVLSLAFLVKKVIALDVDYKAYFSADKTYRYFIGLFVYTIIMIFQYIPWKAIIQSLTGVKLSGLKTMQVFLKASLMKYIPGNVFQYVGRAEIISEDNRLNVTNISTSIILDSVSVVIAALLGGLLGANDYTNILLKKNYRVIIAIVVVCIVLIVIFKSAIRKWINKKEIKLSVSTAITFIIAIIFYVFTLLAQSMVMTYVFSIISERDIYSKSLTIFGAYSVGWVAGYLTPGASGGIGIRETIMCMLLKGSLSNDIVVVGVIVFRLITICADILAFGLIYGGNFLYIFFKNICLKRKIK